jgi:RNA:NAD 2'-phosphotransferase (TPT1/KptA family)
LLHFEAAIRARYGHLLPIQIHSDPVSARGESLESDTSSHSNSSEVRS